TIPCSPTQFTLFIFTAPAPPKHYTLSLHDALPICERRAAAAVDSAARRRARRRARGPGPDHERRSDELADRDVERPRLPRDQGRSEEHTSELQSLAYLVCRLLLEKKKVVHHYASAS